MLLSDIKGIGTKYKEILNKNNVIDTNDLIKMYPYKYNVLKRSDINTLKQDDYIIMDGKVETIPYVLHFKKIDKMSFKINNGSNFFNVVIFNRGFYKSKLLIGTDIIVIGKYDLKHNTIVASELRFGLLPSKPTIEPVYHQIGSITSKIFKSFIDKIINEDINVVDYIPDYLKEKYDFLSKEKSIKILHNPSNIDDLKKSRLRMKYEELFVFMLKMNYLKINKNKYNGLKRDVPYDKVLELIDSLPFELTKDQLSSIDDIYNDLVSVNRMNRMLQGDVGSGKTIVSFIALYINYLSHYQGCLMAPTEILANQHYENIKSLFPNINICLLTSKTKGKKTIYENISKGNIDIVIGTHAIFNEELKYNNLGLVITDEQHRFGVNQRKSLKNKGITPDILYMSATPIPRTYALTLYGDMDISNIYTMPNGRKKIQTFIKKESEIKEVLYSMYEQIKLGHQIYVIAPLIEENDDLGYESVTKLEKNMNEAFNKVCKIGVLHGKMKSNEKEVIMNSFYNNEIQILISTTVVEVGVNVANATMIVIYDAFRFGLATLHQLRGRVGRSSYDSYCYLISNYEKDRLRIMESTNDGFKISEEDFKLRGSGDLFGTKQSGDMVFKVANIKNDYNLLLKARSDSYEFLNEYIDNYSYFKELIEDNLD